MIRRHPLIGSAGSKYGLVYTDNNAVFLERQTANGAITDSKKLKIKIKELKGKSFVWNQQLKEINTTNYTETNIISIANGKITFTGNGSTYYSASNMTTPIDIIAGHTYLFAISVSNNTITKTEETFGIGKTIGSLFINVIISGVVGRVCAIKQATTSQTLNVVGYAARSAGSVAAGEMCSVSDMVFIDLTSLNIDNLTTVEEVETWLANNIGDFPYYAYNPGTILNSKYNIFESVEFNQWDEEWEQGTYNTTTGEKQASSNAIRNKNIIPVFPSTQYYFQHGNNLQAQALYYDANKNFIGSNTIGGNVKLFTTRTGAYYMNFRTLETSYSNNICINLSNPIHNGQYKPYKHHIINLNLTTLTGKVNGEGESVIIFPDGMRSANPVYDYFIIDENGYARMAVKVMEGVDLGTCTWTINSAENNIFVASIPNMGKQKDRLQAFLTTKYQIDSVPSINNKMTDKTCKKLNGSLYIRDTSFNSANDFKASLSGVELIYVLAEPITYVLDNPIYVGTYGHSYGVERILPQNTEEPYTTPANMVIDYLAKK